MTDQHNPEDTAALKAAVKRFRPEAPPGSCPDPAYLAALLDHSLLPSERERIEAHVAVCRSCLEVVTELAEASEAEAALTPASGGGRIPFPGRGVRVLTGVAAGILAIVVLTTWQPWRDRRDTDARLVASAEDLGRSHPAMFKDFRPLSREERAAQGPVVRGAASAAVLPTGKVLETRPTFRFLAAAQATGYEIRLLSAAGEVVLTAGVTPPIGASVVDLPFPSDAKDLVPGETYLWTVGRAGGPKEAVDVQLFSIASPSERATFEEAQRTIATNAPAAIEGLLRAHHALRGEYLGEAERLARAYVAAHPDDAPGRETLDRVLRALGLPEEGGPRK